MELENMKELWQQYDKNLQASNILNEKMIKNMLAEKSNERLNSFTKMEYLSLAIACILLMIFVALGYKVGSEMQVIVPYIVSLMIFTFVIGWGIYKLRLINNIDTYSDTIVNTKERLEKLRLIFAREKVWSMILMPIVMCSLAPVLHHWLWGGYFSDHLKSYIPRLVAGYGVFIVLTYWMYKTLYSKNIKIILGNLKELEDLKKE
jgi:uncharacterized membrane protein